MCLPSPEWVDQSTSSNDKLVACKLQHTGDQSVTVTRSVTVNGNLSWCVHVHGQALDSTKCNALKNFPVTITTKAALNQLLTLVDTLSICAGHPDQHFLDLADSANFSQYVMTLWHSQTRCIPPLSMEKHILVLFVPLPVRFWFMDQNVKHARSIALHFVLYIVSGRSSVN